MFGLEGFEKIKMLRIVTVRLLKELLETEAEHDALHQLHVDEARIFLLDVLQLLVGGVRHPLLAVSGHANQVRHNLREKKDCGLLLPPSIQGWRLGSNLIKT